MNTCSVLETHWRLCNPLMDVSQRGGVLQNGIIIHFLLCRVCVSLEIPVELVNAPHGMTLFIFPVHLHYIYTYMSMQTKGNQGLLLVYIHLCVPVGETLGCMYMVYMFPLGEKVFCEVWAVVQAMRLGL